MTEYSIFMLDLYFFILSVAIFLFVIGISYLGFDEIRDRFKDGNRVELPVIIIGLLIVLISVFFGFMSDLVTVKQMAYYFEEASKIGLWFGCIITATGFVIWITDGKS